METTIHIRRIDGYGWLPTITVGTAEVYRGEFRETAYQAFCHAEKALIAREARLAVAS